MKAVIAVFLVQTIIRESDVILKIELIVYNDINYIDLSSRAGK